MISSFTCIAKKIILIFLATAILLLWSLGPILSYSLWDLKKQTFWSVFFIVNFSLSLSLWAQRFSKLKTWIHLDEFIWIHLFLYLWHSLSPLYSPGFSFVSLGIVFLLSAGFFSSFRTIKYCYFPGFFIPSSAQFIDFPLEILTLTTYMLKTS